MYMYVCRSYEGSIKGLQSPFGYNNNVHPEQPSVQYVPVPKDNNTSSQQAVIEAEVENRSNNTTNMQRPEVLDSSIHPVIETSVKPVVAQDESAPVARSIFSFFDGNPPPG